MRLILALAAFVLPRVAFGLETAPSLQPVRAAAERALELLDHAWVDHGGLEVITGGPSAALTQSRWGHLALRFVGSGPSSLEDTVVEVIALNSPADGPWTVVTRGLGGGYPIVPAFESLGALIQGYYFRETRGYARTILPSTAGLRRALLDTFRAVVRERLGVDQYYFLTENCASYLSGILSRAGFTQTPTPIPFFPAQAGLHFRRSFLSPWPEVAGVSAAELKRLSSPRVLDRLAARATLELQRLLAFRGTELNDVSTAVRSVLESRSDLSDTDRVYGITPLPVWMYQAAAPAETDARAVFSRAQLERAVASNRAVNDPNEICVANPRQCAAFRAVQHTLEWSLRE